MAAASTSIPPLGKFLASTDKKTRDKAIKDLSTFLSNSSEDALPESEMLKLWKGIFYCFWMSDKPLVQQALASDLAELLLTIPTTSLSLSFLRGFWEMIVREWSGIDRLRIDKYYMFIRRFTNASFRLLIREKWNKNVCEKYNSILSDVGGPLCPSDIKIPAGLTYHLSDIYIEELDKALSTPSPSPVPLTTIITPFLMLAAITPNTATYKHIQSTLFDPLFDALTPSTPTDEPPSRKRPRLTAPTYGNIISNSCTSDEEGPSEKAVLLKSLLKQLFELAGQESTRDANRKKMYAIWKAKKEEEDSDSESV